jgi:hypothetical protein
MAGSLAIVASVTALCAPDDFSRTIQPAISVPTTTPQVDATNEGGTIKVTSTPVEIGSGGQFLVMQNLTISSGAVTLTDASNHAAMIVLNPGDVFLGRLSTTANSEESGAYLVGDGTLEYALFNP